MGSSFQNPVSSSWWVSHPSGLNREYCGNSLTCFAACAATRCFACWAWPPRWRCTLQLRCSLGTRAGLCPWAQCLPAAFQVRSNHARPPFREAPSLANHGDRAKQPQPSQKSHDQMLRQETNKVLWIIAEWSNATHTLRNKCARAQKLPCIGRWFPGLLCVASLLLLSCRSADAAAHQEREV